MSVGTTHLGFHSPSDRVKMAGVAQHSMAKGNLGNICGLSLRYCGRAYHAQLSTHYEL